MNKRRLLVASAAAVSTAAALLFGGLTAHGTAPAVRSKAAPQTDQLAAGFAAGNTQALVAQLQAGLRSRPQNVRGLDLLGLAYQQRARETGDPSYYVKSDGVLQRAARLAPNDLDAISGLASLALSRHRFALALALGRRALEISPTTARNYGVVGDAQLELGRYKQAFAAFDTMARLKPGVSSYTRIAYARELLGSLDGARNALLLSRDAAADEREPLAWTETQLGKLELSRGRLGRCRDAPARSAADVPRLRVRARRARPGRARARPPSPRHVARAARGRDDPPAAVRRPLRRPAARNRPRACRARPVRDRGRHPPPAERQRRAHRPRNGALRHRPRHPAARLTGTRPEGTARTAVDRRRRRAGLGARPQRQVLRGTPLLEARAAARHEGHRQALPPRGDRAVPRPRPAPMGTSGGPP